MSFSGHNPYDPTADAEPRTFSVIANNGFFPDIDPAHFIKQMRISNEYRTEAITHALEQALLELNAELEPKVCRWVSEQQHYTLADIPCDQINHQSVLVLRYQTAAYHFAKCHLLRAYATMNRKEQAENVGKEAEQRCPELIDEYQRMLQYLKNYNLTPEAQTMSQNGFSVELIE